MKRQLDKTIIDSLIKTDLWINEIEKDCKSQNVFLQLETIRLIFIIKAVDYLILINLALKLT